MGRSRYKITDPKLPHFVKGGYVDEAVHWRIRVQGIMQGRGLMGGVSNGK